MSGGQYLFGRRIDSAVPSDQQSRDFGSRRMVRFASLIYNLEVICELVKQPIC
jgi:hypothetical protein